MTTRIKLTQFRIQNFQCVDDSGWIEIDDPTTFLGKNESGKTALLTALYKLNPATPVKYDGLYEFPRSRYTDEFQIKDWIVATGEFNVPKNLLEKWQPPQNYTIPDGGIKLVLSRHYSGKLKYLFDPKPQDEDYKAISTQIIEELRQLISRKMPVTPTSETEDQSNNQQQFTQDQKKALLKLFDDYTIELNTLRSFCDNVGNFVALVPELEKVLDEIEEIIKKKDLPSYSKQLWQTIKSEVPVFIYFENYGILDGLIHIPTFVQQIKAKLFNSKIRTQLTLFKHVKLDPIELYEKGDMGVDFHKLQTLNASEAKKLTETYSKDIQRAISERQILLSSASQKMSEKFAGWWAQRTHTFDYSVDSHYFEILVSDNVKPEKIPFNNRSKGLKWFFSFYLVFLVESEEMHRNAILLLDEPGLSLHPTAKLNLIKFFDELQEKNQVIYSTHSPFLIDGDHLEKVRGVIEGEDGKTRVVTSVGITDKHTAFPLQALVGYTIMQTLFLGQKHLLVEGMSDYNYIKGMSLILQRFTLVGLNEEIVIVPSGGASKVSYLASLFISQGSKPVVLLDADNAGIGRKKSLALNLFATQQDNLLLVNEFVTAIKNAEVEDIIGSSLLLKSLEKILDQTPSISDLGNDSFCDEIKGWYEKRGVALPLEWKVLLSIQFHNDAVTINQTDITPDIMARFEQLIEKINKLLS